MPIYEYKCENGHVFDVMQKLSDEPLTRCVECGAPVRKVLHPVSIAFKGSGFYSTDYRGGKTEPAKNGDAGKKEGTSEKSSSTGTIRGARLTIRGSPSTTSASLDIARRWSLARAPATRRLNALRSSAVTRSPT